MDRLGRLGGLGGGVHDRAVEHHARLEGAIGGRREPRDVEVDLLKLMAHVASLGCRLGEGRLSHLLTLGIPRSGLAQQGCLATAQLAAADFDPYPDEASANRNPGPDLSHASADPGRQRRQPPALGTPHFDSVHRAARQQVRRPRLARQPSARLERRRRLFHARPRLERTLAHQAVEVDGHVHLSRDELQGSPNEDVGVPFQARSSIEIVK